MPSSRPCALPPPRRSMTPTPSWPGMIGRPGLTGHSPRAAWMSVWQRPEASMRTSTSSAPGTGTGTSSMDRGWSKLWTTAARMTGPFARVLRRSHQTPRASSGGGRQTAPYFTPSRAGYASARLGQAAARPPRGRDRRAQLCPLARPGGDLQRAVDQRQALADPDQPEPVGPPAGVEALPVVADPDLERPVGLDHGDLDVPRAGVPRRVRHRLLDQAVHRGLDVRRVPRLRPAGLVVEIDGEADLRAVRQGAHALHERLHRRLRPELVERGGAQVGDDRAQLVDALAEALDGVVHSIRQALGVAAAARGGQRDAQRRHVLQRLVVQLAGPALPLALGRLDAALQPVGGELLRGRDGGRGAGREGFQQLLVVAAELRAGDLA